MGLAGHYDWGVIDVWRRNCRESDSAVFFVLVTEFVGAVNVCLRNYFTICVGLSGSCSFV